ncbi:hypothetical protein CRE_06787 [Caenorhabditis remanei]|uniref:Uncharacterized protein n=1 Tax=Caenorhabditis remanei TaxID=31234 RepID=E3MNU0_CAERE|nr:hypothetical protein CRE_06787 [Caenorhabditis remanei]
MSTGINRSRNSSVSTELSFRGNKKSSPRLPSINFKSTKDALRGAIAQSLDAASKALVELRNLRDDHQAGEVDCSLVDYLRKKMLALLMMLDAMNISSVSWIMFSCCYPRRTVCSSQRVLDLSSRCPREDMVSVTGPISISVLTSGALGAGRNAANYDIQIGGRSSNVVSVFDKNVISSLGNSKWFARVDMPHGNVPYHHINVNKAITGVKDPHIPISATTAKAAGVAGKVLIVVNRISPYLTVFALVYNGYQLGKSVIVDLNNGTTRNTLKEVARIVISLVGGIGGSVVGASEGTRLFPGVGTLVGGVAGSIAGGAGGVYVLDPLLESALDDLKLDILEVECTECQKVFECRKYEIGDVKKCEACRTSDDLPRIPELKEMVMPVWLKIRSKL